VHSPTNLIYPSRWELAMLTQSQKKFIDNRMRLHKYWPWITALLALLWGGVSLFFYFRYPLFANPFFVIEQLEKNQVEPTTMILLSAMSPIFVMTIGFLLLVLIIFFADRMLTEKKLLQIIGILIGNR
jgi:hypothetical protein